MRKGAKMTTTKGFTCASCGNDHEGDLTDRAFTLPDDVWAIPKSERSEHAKFDTDLCKFGDRYFIRCVLYVPFTFNDEAFGWGVWAEVPEDTFFRYIDIYGEDGSEEPPRRGKLANALTLYSDSNREDVTITFGNATSRPTLETLPSSRKSLAIDQRSGIDRARYHTILHDAGVL